MSKTPLTYDQVQPPVIDAQVEGEDPKQDFTGYWGNVLNSFETGAQLDLRARLAVEFVKSGTLVHLQTTMSALTPESGAATLAAKIASFALDLASELIDQSRQRGLIKDLPQDDGLNLAVRTQIRRNARAQIYQQVATQDIAPEEMPHVAPAGSGLIPRGQRRS